MASPKIKLMIVDDSALVRQAVISIFEDDPEVLLLPSARDPIHAMECMEKMWPDVIVLDIEMPRMDGLTFLAQIMSTRPTPVIIMSTLAVNGSSSAMKAIELGAVATIHKPKVGCVNFFQNNSTDITSIVKQAAFANAKKMIRSAPVHALPLSASSQESGLLIAIGASMGGTKAIEEVLMRMPLSCPPIVVTQHMPETFTKLFADRLNSICDITVREAEDGDLCSPGTAYIAPGGRHLGIKHAGNGGYACTVSDGPLVTRHKPSVDYMFRSIAKCAGSNVAAAILTGIGDDGARGLLEIYEAGGSTMAEAEETCVVFGMPKEAIRLGAAQKVVPLPHVAAELLSQCRKIKPKH